MLRIYFTPDDIARTRLAATPDPLWDLVLSLQMLRGQRGDLLFTRWRQETARSLRKASLGGYLELLSSLVPVLGYFPDFLNPAEALRGLDDGLEAIRSTPKYLLFDNMAHLAKEQKRLPPAAAEIAIGEPMVLDELTRTMRTYYDIAILPYQRAINMVFELDRRSRLLAFSDSGVEGLLDSLRPMLIWEAGELRVEAHRNQEIHLDGRGLLLVPSYFCVNHPMTMFDPSLPPVLIYPVPHSAASLATLDNGHRVGLGELVGRTRAAMLESIGAGCTTSELAQRVGVSAASASEQASILRGAHLITSQRDRNRMVHQLTNLGLALLNGA